ncbi:MAG: dTDP-3-amino-3,4,6-trideoxy-alpha-D-glucopyranose [Firmicutes bacterium ADurb.BinA052]|nr:MAG: dTDP-3-amino-3,4,6-trideoxy-alpha-D-glucopyranose [Firmicutes bacterium ADurb.BinA052]
MRRADRDGHGRNSHFGDGRGRGGGDRCGEALPQYEGFFAEFYDILHSSYDADLNIYLDLAKQHGDPALELGCGTGRLLIPLAAAGHAVTGLDLSRDMLTKCQEKLDIEGEATAKRVSLVQGDIRRFELGRKFNLIIAACNTILHCTAVQDLLAVLARAREHLAPGGVFAVDFSIPNVKAMIECSGEEEVFEVIHPVRGSRIVDTYRAAFDFVRQIETIDTRLEEWDGRVLLRSARARSERGIYFPREVALALRCSGFRIVKTWKGYRRGPLVETSQDMVYICRADASPPIGQG